MYIIWMIDGAGAVSNRVYGEGNCNLNKCQSSACLFRKWYFLYKKSLNIPKR
jgi:hypothetical protein